jgi:hypothetical protein
LNVLLSSNLEKAEIRYTLDDSLPTGDSPVYKDAIVLEDTAVVSAQIFREGRPLSGVVKKVYRKIPPRPAQKDAGDAPGLVYAYYQGNWERLPDFSALSPEKQGTVGRLELSPSARKEYFALRFRGYISVPEDGLYRFAIASDDGSRLYIGKELVVDNDGLHGSVEAEGRIILEKGRHPIRIDYFQRTGGLDFEVTYSGPGIAEQPIPPQILFH